MTPSSVPAKHRLVFDGSYDERCQAKRYLDSSGCEEIRDFSISPRKHPRTDSSLRVFWYPENSTASVSRPSLNSLQQKIKAFLLALGNRLGMHGALRGDFVQFWTPVTTEGGRVVLSASKQPFGVRRFSKGLCRYRYYCLDYCSDGRTEVGCDFGPVGRAFTRGLPEFCPHVGNLEEEHFRVKNQVTEHFKHCGIVGYLALPLFEQGGLSCIGVLEFVSLFDFSFGSCHTRNFLEIFKEVGLAFRYPSHSEALTEIRPYFNFPVLVDARKAKFDEMRYVLDLVRKMYSLPLIQVWLPCICKGSEVVTCDPNSSSFAKATHLVCGLQCFDKDEWQTSGLCYDTQVHFVVNGESWVGRAHAQTKICFIKDIKKHNIRDYPRVTFSDSSIGPVLSACIAIPLQLVHPKLPPLVLEVLLPSQYNYHSNHGAILKPLLFVLARELSKYNAEIGLKQGDKYLCEPSQLEDDYDCVYFDVYRHRDASESQHLQLATGNNIRPCQVPSHESIGGRSTLKRKLPVRRSFGMRRSPSCQRNDVLPVQQMPELSTIWDEIQQSGMRYSPSDNSKERELEAARISIPTPGREALIEPGNNEVSHGASIPSTNEKGKNSETGNDEIDHGKGRNTVLESLEADHSCTLIVKARYKDDIVRFPFSTNSGIEGLQRDLLTRFELEVQRIKIKYQDGGEWITLSCSEDLSFHMRTLISSGQTTLDLSVFPVT